MELGHLTIWGAAIDCVGLSHSLAAGEKSANVDISSVGNM